MKTYVKIEKNRYIDSLETLFSTTVLNDQPGIAVGYSGMASDAFKQAVAEAGMETGEIHNCTGADYVVIAKAQSREAFDRAIARVEEISARPQRKDQDAGYASFAEAQAAHPGANLCSIAVPGECALAEVKKALHAGLHCVVFSNNVPLADERAMKELAREKGLLCMGPDCGVANIDGAALVLASITNRGPFGICGASGVGIQHVAAILHGAGSGVSQAIGTGGNDIKEEVGGITMLMGIDALEADPQTEYIVLISRKPADSVLQTLLKRIARVKKPCVVYFMGASREAVEKTGAVWAKNLDDCALKSLELIGKSYALESEAELKAMAAQAVQRMADGQMYVRGLFCGGTYMDEAMRAMAETAGDIWSNSPLTPAMKLPNAYLSTGNTCVDYGEEEFTLGRPHPAIDSSIRRLGIAREASDPGVAVILLDFILTPPGHMDPVGYALEDIIPAMRRAADMGRKLVFVASVLGTDADFQDVNVQRRKLKDAGAIVCKTNYGAARVAGEIVRLRREAKSYGM